VTDTITYPWDRAAIGINGGTEGVSIARVAIENNVIYGPIFDGIAVNGYGATDIRIFRNYVYGYNYEFSRLALEGDGTAIGKERAVNHSSEMGIHISTGEGNNILVESNYVAGFMCEDIVIETWSDDCVKATQSVKVANNRLFDASFRGIALYAPKDCTGVFKSVEVSNNTIASLDGVVLGTPIEVMAGVSPKTCNNFYASKFNETGDIYWKSLSGGCP